MAAPADLPRILFIEQLAPLIGKTATTIRTCATNAKYAHLIPRPFKLPHSRRLCWYERDVLEWIESTRPAEPDCDVWMHALHEARLFPVGASVPVVRSRFLKSLGRYSGNAEYQWLHESFLRLSLGMLEVKTRKYTVGEVPYGAIPSKGIHRVMHLIDGFDLDEELDTYVLRIDRRMARLFSDREFALVDWEKRLQIKRQQDMAKALQRLVATSADTTQRHSLVWLKEKLQYGSPIRKFRRAILAAAAELERLEIIAGARLEQSTHGKEQVVWTRL